MNFLTFTIEIVGVDVEDLYFLGLLEAKRYNVFELNEHFDIIKSELAEYLNG